MSDPVRPSSYRRPKPLAARHGLPRVAFTLATGLHVALLLLSLISFDSGKAQSVSAASQAITVSLVGMNALGPIRQSGVTSLANVETTSDDLNIDEADPDAAAAIADNDAATPVTDGQGEPAEATPAPGAVAGSGLAGAKSGGAGGDPWEQAALPERQHCPEAPGEPVPFGCPAPLDIGVAAARP